MNLAKESQAVQWLPIDRVIVVNPRERSKAKFKKIVENISKIGLKKPITVTKSKVKGDGWYDLVCGQGRLEAYKLLGQQQVPAMVVSADTDDCLIASLVENCARRHHNAIDLLQDIGAMKKRDMSVQDIARKTGLSAEYTAGVIRLLEQGEQRLLQSVHSRNIPLSTAVEIASSDDAGIQQALQDAYEKGLLNGNKLKAAKRLVEKRRSHGKKIDDPNRIRSPKMTTAQLVKTYEEDVIRKKELINRSRRVQDKLLLLVEALRRLNSDKVYIGILEDEKLTTLPESVAERLKHRQAAN